ncbi:acyl-CoA N-acyltransferase [Pholiota conissans]|uniref:Acyl-CoA N-acyltransferase n=1 Tax=Pholiota conissans TaxID=109636 RepID=A0A9P5YJZ8_9AGAR|nr:acyl-CoA N-acyltransferase [Pholiota conissans]
MAFVNGSINGPDMVDVPKSYGMIRDPNGDLIPYGKNAFWVAEAYSPEDPSSVEVVGCVGLDISTSAGEDNAELRRLAVSSNYRGNGIARSLIIALMTHARENGLKSVYLRTWPSNIGALRAYKKMGWVVEQEFVEFKNMVTHVLSLEVANSVL